MLQLNQCARLSLSTQPRSWAMPNFRHKGLHCQLTGDNFKVHSVAEESPAAVPQSEVPGAGWMWSMKPSQGTKGSLKSDNIKPKKSLGQNFVIDDVILEAIVRHSRVAPGDLIVEVGPGTGNLTKHLLAKGALVTAIEKDDTLYERLSKEYSEVKQLQLVHGDVLQVDLQAIINGMLQQSREAAAASAEASTSTSTEAAPSSEQKQPVQKLSKRQVKIVANLPYNITTEFLKLTLPLGGIVSELSIMLQDEAAKRLVDPEPGRPDYRAMNLRVQYYSRPRYCMMIPREQYFPVPGVNGGLVSFDLIPPQSRAKVASEKGFLQMVAQAFSQRRKKMRNTLQPAYTSQQIESALASCGLNVKARAQDLDLKQFVTFYNTLTSLASQEAL